VTLVVGLVGEIAAGKGEAVKFLQKEYKSEVYRFSDVLKELLERLSMDVTRENLQALGRVLRVLFGDNILVEALKQDISSSNADLVVVDGVRYHVEAEMVRSFENNILLYITAPEDVRYQRVLSRATRGEKNITLEEFKRNEENETERAIKKVGESTDKVIENTGSIKELGEDIRKVLENKLA